jgi:hypothetical protein
MRTRSRLARRLLAAGLLAGVVACGGGHRGGVMTPSDLKTSSWRSHVGEMVDLEGYLRLNADGTGVLLQDPEDYYENRAVPEQHYVALGSETLRGLDPQGWFLSLVRLRGRVRSTLDPDRMAVAGLLGDLSQCEVEPVGAPTRLRPGLLPGPVYLSPCIHLGGLCQLQPVGVPTKYALLYSGGIDKDHAYERYWNDLALYYAMLVWLYHFDPANIVVVYKDGVPENDDAPVDQAATPAGLNAAFQDLATRMDANDEFFFFITNHGGQAPDAGSPAPGDEDFQLDTIDETTFYYDQNGAPYDDDIAAYVNALRFGKMICVMEQCFSGGFIYDLRGPNRVLVSAANEVEVSSGGALYDDFLRLFASALLGVDPVDGTSVHADTDHDGKVSIYEAFRWAALEDAAPEHPQYEDSGDGLPVGYPSLGLTTDGALGANTFP